MDPKRGNLHQLSDAQRVQLVDTLEPIIAEILEIRAEEHPTASVINIDPVVSGKHRGTSLLITADSQRLYETMAETCSSYRFNSYEYRCISFGDILLRKVGERYELSVNFWPKDD